MMPRLTYRSHAEFGPQYQPIGFSLRLMWTCFVISSVQLEGYLTSRRCPVKLHFVMRNNRQFRAADRAWFGFYFSGADLRAAD